MVDISRGTRAPSNAIGGKMVAVGDEADADAPHVDDHPSSGTTDGKPDVLDATAGQGDGDKDVTSRPDVPMEDVAHEGLEEGSPKTESTVAHVTNGNAGAGKNGDAAPMKSSEVAQGVESPVKDSGDSIVSNGLPQDKDRERLMKNGGSRKRKKTIHYINSRVPHSRAPNAAVPALESEEGSDGQDSAEEADDVPVRPSQAPRAAATKVGLLKSFAKYFRLCTIENFEVLTFELCTLEKWNVAMLGADGEDCWHLQLSHLHWMALVFLCTIY